MRTSRRGFTLLELLIVLSILAILAAVLFPVAHRTKENAPRSSCQSNLKQIGLGFLQYAQDYDDTLVPVAPLAKSRRAPRLARPYGWADAIQPYVKSIQLLQCPSEPSKEASASPAQDNFTDYWMNLNLSRAKMKYFTSPTQTILAGEGNDGTGGTDARYCLNALPSEWLADKDSPARRHLGTMNILFADGHVKSLKSEDVANGAPRGREATFARKWRPQPRGLSPLKYL